MKRRTPGCAEFALGRLTLGCLLGPSLGLLLWSAPASATGSPSNIAVKGIAVAVSAGAEAYLALSAHAQQRSGGLLITTGSLGTILAIAADELTFEDRDMREAPSLWFTMLANQIALGGFFELAAARRDMPTAYALSWGYGANLGLTLATTAGFLDNRKPPTSLLATGISNAAAQWGLCLWRLRKPLDSAGKVAALSSAAWATVLPLVQAASLLIPSASPSLARLPFQMLPDIDVSRRSAGVLLAFHFD